MNQVTVHHGHWHLAIFKSGHSFGFAFQICHTEGGTTCYNSLTDLDSLTIHEDQFPVGFTNLYVWQVTAPSFFCDVLAGRSIHGQSSASTPNGKSCLVNNLFLLADTSILHGRLALLLFPHLWVQEKIFPGHNSERI